MFVRWAKMKTLSESNAVLYLCQLMGRFVRCTADVVMKANNEFWNQLIFFNQDVIFCCSKKVLQEYIIIIR